MLVRRSSPARFSVQRNSVRSLVLSACQFPHVLQEQKEGVRTRLAFEENPLASLSPKTRGEVLARIARGLQSNECGGASTHDAIPGVRYDGHQRSNAHAEYDWLYKGRRVECKSSMFQWNISLSRWVFHFKGIKVATAFSPDFQSLFDDLVIVLLAPDALYVYQHDLSLGLTSTGYDTEIGGHDVQLSGPRQEQCWQHALDVVLARLDLPTNGCKHIATLPVWHADVQAELETFTSSRANCVMGTAYEGVPMVRLSPTARSLTIKKIVREIDQMLHPSAHFDEAVPSARINGPFRSRNQEGYDWSRDGLRVRCKSAQMCWNGTIPHWKVHFRNVRVKSGHIGLTCPDEIILAMFTPRGLYLYKHLSDVGLASNGLRTSLHGHSIFFGSPKREQDWSLALAAILCKLESSPCEFLAVVEWGNK